MNAEREQKFLNVLLSIEYENILMFGTSEIMELATRIQN